MTESSTERAAGRPIAWEDVRVGDTIERRLTSKGVTYSERGTVAKIDGAYLHTAEGGTIASHYGGPSPRLTAAYLHTAEGGAVASYYGGKSLFLIARPKPELPIEVGSVIVNATIRGVPGQVATLVDAYGGQFWRTSITLAGVCAHDPEHITEWTLGKVVPA